MDGPHTGYGYAGLGRMVGMGLVGRRGVRAGIDVTILAAAYLLATVLRFDGSVPTAELNRMATSLPFVVLVQYVALSSLAVPRCSWQFFSLRDARAVVRALVAAALVLAGVRVIAYEMTAITGAFRPLVIPFGVIVLDLALAVAGTVGARALRRSLVEHSRFRERVPSRDGPAKRVLLLGAGEAGAMVARELQGRPDLGLVPVAFLDDDPRKHGSLVRGVPVLGGTTETARLAGELDADEAVITIANTAGPTIRRIAAICERAGLSTRVVPSVHEIVSGHVPVSRLRPVAVEDLLRRPQVELDMSAIGEIVRSAVVLVTGAGGSIGSELCRQLAPFGPRSLVLVERSENALWAVVRELSATFPLLEMIPELADVRDRDRMARIMAASQPSIVFHASAHKHVPMMERHPGEAVKNNVLATRTVADLAAAGGVERFVLISTDKAVNPTSVMGATKRLAERYVQHVAAETGRRYASVRFGNVLGSAGSVVPVFQEQIRAGGPVTVTHPDMTRYFMTIPEASQLVLQAAAMSASGEVFVLDMGEPVRIVDLARDLIRLSGYTPEEEIEIVFTGSRPGEKLAEELLGVGERTSRTQHPKILVHRAPAARWESVARDLRLLEAVMEGGDPETVRSALASLVPEYGPPGGAAATRPTAQMPG
jgi:FlaA1/EpsC-like NDP-sugar epimerase